MDDFLQEDNADKKKQKLKKKRQAKRQAKEDRAAAQQSQPNTARRTVYTKSRFMATPAKCVAAVA